MLKWPGKAQVIINLSQLLSPFTPTIDFGTFTAQTLRACKKTFAPNATNTPIKNKVYLQTIFQPQQDWSHPSFSNKGHINQNDKTILTSPKITMNLLLRWSPWWIKNATPPPKRSLWVQQQERIMWRKMNQQSDQDCLVKAQTWLMRIINWCSTSLHGMMSTSIVLLCSGWSH